MTYDTAARAAEMFSAAMAEAGYPLRKPAWVVHEDDDWQCWWPAHSAPVEVENKARLLVAHSLGVRVSCARCWIESDCGLDLDRCMACARGNCPYEHEVSRKMTGHEELT